MKKIVLLLAFAMAWFGLPATAAIVTSSPVILQESSSNVVLTYHADDPQGNMGLANLPTSTQVYAHIGVITNLSSEWTYTITPWPERDGSNADSANTPKNHLTRVADNTYSLSIGNIREYFGITNPAEHVTRIALVFRNADGSKEGKTASGGDIFVSVLPDGFAMAISTDATSNVINQPTTITFTVNATAAADLTLKINGNQIASASAATILSKAYTFSDKKTYTVEATALYEGKTYTEKTIISYPEASTPGTYPGGIPKQGAVRNADGSVTFCLAAPGKNSVVLVPSWNDYVVTSDYTMKYQDYQGNRFFWITVNGLENDVYYPYYYLVDGLTSVADPYAHLVLDCYSDKWLDSSIWPDMPAYPYDKFDNIMLAVYRGDMDDFDWTDGFTIPDHSQLVVYELLFRDFTGTVGAANANGTVAQAIEKIPYLKELGINAVELMPIMEFNGNISWGYNTNFYFAPDKSYGSPDDYRRFIDECHRNGIAVILDIVFNQSDGLHPWYQMYPIASNPFYNAEAPHAYSVLNDWNQGGNSLVEQQWCDALRYWMTAYNVDGFRFDLVKGLGDNNSYGGGTDSYNSSRIERMKRLHAVIKSVKPNGIHINEDLAQPSEEIELGNDGMLQWANINRSSGRFVCGWNENEAPGNLTGGAGATAFLSTADTGRPWGSTVSYAESHDEQRLGYYIVANAKNNTVRNARYSRLGTLATEMLLTPGPKMIWQFGELGDDQNTKNGGDNNTDPKVVPWNLLDDPDAKALHDTYMGLCQFRKLNPELFASGAEFETSGLDATLVTARTMRLRAGNKEAIALINSSITSQAKTVSATASGDPSGYRLLLASPGFNATPTVSGNSISVRLAGGSFAIYVSPETASVDEILSDENSLAEPVYYNLQGVRVDRPDTGIYIVRRGTKVTKELVR